MKRKSVLLAAVLMAVLALSAVQMSPQSEASATVGDGDISVKGTVGSVSIYAGTSKTFDIVVVNNLPYVANSTENQRMILFSLEEHGGISSDAGVRYIILEGQKFQTVTITLSADKYAKTEVYYMEMKMDVRAMDGTDTSTVSKMYTIQVKVDSPLSSGDSFNKILGVFDNNLPSPLNQPWASAIITFIIWTIIGLVVAAIVTPILFRILSHRGADDDDKLSRKSVRNLIIAVVVLFSFEKSLLVIGAPEEAISSVRSWVFILYVVIGALITWKLYRAFIKFTLCKVGQDMGSTDSSDLEPLFNLLGKLIIAIVAVVLIMASLGINVAAIITSAGLVSLGITYGASSIISQFFNGLVLLVTRPFKAGDVVTVGTSRDNIYRVRQVKVMNTVFENWSNEDIVVMPNNMVASSVIVNMTGKGEDIYKIHVVINVAYGADLEKAKDIMLDVAKGHPNTVMDGTKDTPYIRVTNLKDSSVELRVTAYVHDFEDHNKFAAQIRDGILKRFKSEGIEIPFPQCDVHIRND